MWIRHITKERSFEDAKCHDANEMGTRDREEVLKEVVGSPLAGVVREGFLKEGTF